MIRIRVSYTTQLKAAIGASSETFEFAAPPTVAELLDRLSTRHGETFRNLVLDPAGGLASAILLCVGDAQVAYDRTAPLQTGDEVTILSAISGG
jgi:molybdopterin converting factor small subunit